MPQNPIYVAIDQSDLRLAIELAEKVKEYVGGIKVGYEFFFANGISGLKAISDTGLPIFLDLKLFDIPNTVHKSLLSILTDCHNIHFVTIHATAGPETASAAIRACNESRAANTKIIAVTTLTSSNIEDGLLKYSIPAHSYPAIRDGLLHSLSIAKDSEGGIGHKETIKTWILQASNSLLSHPGAEEYKKDVIGQMSLLKNPKEQARPFPTKQAIYSLSLCYFVLGSKIDGFVSSALDAQFLRLMLGEKFDIVSPGIRPSWYGTRDDQRRTSTPTDALLNGSSHLVVGRPISAAKDPALAAQKIYEEVQEAQLQRARIQSSD